MVVDTLPLGLAITGEGVVLVGPLVHRGAQPFLPTQIEDLIRSGKLPRGQVLQINGPSVSARLDYAAQSWWMGRNFTDCPESISAGHLVAREIMWRLCHEEDLSYRQFHVFDPELGTYVIAIQL